MPAPACHSWGKALTTWLPLDPGADDLGAGRWQAELEQPTGRDRGR